MTATDWVFECCKTPNWSRRRQTLRRDTTGRTTRRKFDQLDMTAGKWQQRNLHLQNFLPAYKSMCINPWFVGAKTRCESEPGGVGKNWSLGWLSVRVFFIKRPLKTFNKYDDIYKGLWSNLQKGEKYLLHHLIKCSRKKGKLSGIMLTSFGIKLRIWTHWDFTQSSDAYLRFRVYYFKKFVYLIVFESSWKGLIFALICT